MPVHRSGRVNKWAAMELKSRLLLYAVSPLYANGAGDAQKWQKAANAALAVMDLNRYSLVTNLDANPGENYKKLFVKQTATSEDIFMRFYVSTSSSGVRAIPIERMKGLNGSGGWGGNCPKQNFVDD